MAKQKLFVLSMKDKIITTHTHKMLCENGQSQFRLSNLRDLQLRGPNCKDVH